MDYLDKHCRVIALIKVEGIFIDLSNEFIQVKLCEIGIHKESAESPSLLTVWRWTGLKYVAFFKLPSLVT